MRSGTSNLEADTLIRLPCTTVPLATRPARVEDALYDGRLKAVVYTSSLDLVWTLGRLKPSFKSQGVARFIQRAGRSGHQPGADSHIYFVPTLPRTHWSSSPAHIDRKIRNSKNAFPTFRSFDVLIQYLATLVVAEGFHPDQVYDEIKSTFCFRDITDEDWYQTLDFPSIWQQVFGVYDEYQNHYWRWAV